MITVNAIKLLPSKHQKKRYFIGKGGKQILSIKENGKTNTPKYFKGYTFRMGFFSVITFNSKACVCKDPPTA